MASRLGGAVVKIGDLVKEVHFDFEAGLVIGEHSCWVLKVLMVNSGKIESIHKDYLEVISESR